MTSQLGCSSEVPALRRSILPVATTFLTIVVFLGLSRAGLSEEEPGLPDSDPTPEAEADAEPPAAGEALPSGEVPAAGETPAPAEPGEAGETEAPAEEPLPEEPTAEEPLPEEPAAEEVLPEEPTAEEPLPEEPAAEEVLPEEPTAEEPLPEEPAAEEVLPEEPAAEEPLPEEPAAEEPLPEEPAAEEPPSEEPSAGPGPEAEAELLDLLEIRASVFLDRNGDGLWNEGESGVEGAVVTLRLEPCGSFPEEETSGVTGAGGTCRFEVAEAAGPQGEPCSSRLYLDLSQGAAAGYATTTPNPQEVRLVRDEPGGGAAFGVRLPVANAEMRVERVLAVSEQTVEARVFLTAPDPVEGFVTALRHDPRLRLESISIEGTAAAENGADFSSFDLVPGGGTAGVVMDLFEPFLGNTIPPGDNLPVARYAFSCPQVAAGEPQLELPLELVDGVFGNPPKENIIVVGGRSLSPVLVPGAILVSPESIPGGVRFLAGGPLGEDGLPRDLVGTAGETLELNFYYDLPLGGGPGTPSEDGLQGLSMALAYDCQVEVLEGSFRLPPDSAALLAGAEYVNFHADNSSADGDGCEMVLGLLVDAQAPFEGNVLPAGAGPQRIAAADVRIAAAALCNVCLPVEFQDGVNGRGKIPARNLYAAGNQSFPAATRSTRVCVTPEAAFKRGDCNGDGKINTTDAAVTIMFLFPFWSGAYSPDCFDACDANDNGSIEVTDAVRVLRWLFLGGEVPPPPGVERPGPDPTPDALGCERRPCPPR